MLGAIDGVRDLSLTTNGVLLDRLAGPLVEAGLTRINVSLDSLSHVRFAEITRRDALDRVLAGLAEAERYPELRPIKVNCVAIKGFTEEEVPALAELARRKPYVVRFIEFMPLDADEAWREDEVLTGGEIRALIEEHWPLEEIPGQAVVHGPPLPVRRRRGRDRLRQPGLGAVLLELRPDPAHRRRPAPHVPLLAPRVGSEAAATGRRERRGARRPAPLRRPPQGAQAQDQRRRLRTGVAVDEPDRRLGPTATVARRVQVERAAVVAERRPVARRVARVEILPVGRRQLVRVRAGSCRGSSQLAHALNREALGPRLVRLGLEEMPGLVREEPTEAAI